MAKLLKITGYLVADDDINETEVANISRQILASKFDCIEKPFNVESVDLGTNLYENWTNHPLNSIHCSLHTCESYFHINYTDFLPCPIGTQVYEILSLFDDEENTSSLYIDTHRLNINDLAKFGKTVFSDVDEAKETLKKLKEV